MTTGDELPLVIASEVDPSYECVLVDPAAAQAPPAPPSDDLDEWTGDATPPLCPPGYVPRLVAGPPYESDGGKVISTPEAPEENPEPPPAY